MSSGKLEKSTGIEQVVFHSPQDGLPYMIVILGLRVAAGRLVADVAPSWP